MYRSELEIENVVRGFERCKTNKAAFKHREHLTVGVVYLQTLDTQAAVERLRTSLLRFVDHHGVPREKYSQEVTVFWIELIAEKLAELAPDAGLVEKCNYVIQRTANTRSNQTARKPAAQVEGEESLAKS